LVESKNSVCTASQVKEIVKEYITCLEQTFPKFIKGNYDLRSLIIDSSMISPCDYQLQIINKIQMENLDFKAYQETPIFLLNVEKYLVNFDHYFYWSFATDIIRGINTIQKDFDNDISQRFFFLMDVIFSRTYNPWETADSKRVREAQNALSPRKVIHADNHIIIAHLSYPLIDGLLKSHWKKCIGDNENIPEFSNKEFVSDDGVNVPLKKLLVDSRISNLAQLLRAVEHFTKNMILKDNLKLFRAYFEDTYGKMYEGKKGYDIISEQRNSLLHGGTPWDKLFAGLVSLIIVLINANLNENEFNKAKQEILQRISMNFSYFQEISYYPPV